MNGKLHITALVLLFFLGGAGSSLAQQASSTNYSLSSCVMSGGGRSASSPTYSVSGVTGQAVANDDAESTVYGTNTGFFNDLDLDGDAVLGPADLCPTVFAACSDLDGDGCVDIPDVDGDTDGVTVGQCDCDDANDGIWETPGEVLNLVLSHDPLGGITTLAWDPPARPGSDPVPYDTLRSEDPTNFVSAMTCIEAADASDTESQDTTDPPSGVIRYYLVRARNACPAGTGTVGTDSDLHLRPYGSCL